ncbi:MAG: precorrin-6A reductase [Deltaproteobacteria bacterium]|nr:precorrin-6A reductase [Deltaproteobacteria bacterium]
MMILLIGGTSETASFAEALAVAGFDVLVSTATDVALEVGRHPRIFRRCGRLDQAGLVRLITEKDIRAVVDIVHPYAGMARLHARMAAAERHIPYLSWVRPAVLLPEESLFFAPNHLEAAQLACSFQATVFLTTGSRNLEPYVAEAARAGVRLVIRVLSHRESRAACHAARIPDDNIITGRGPFTVADNLAVLRRFDVGVMVTKDSGAAGGVLDKLAAAKTAGCKVVVVARPEDTAAPSFTTAAELVTALSAQ